MAEGESVNIYPARLPESFDEDVVYLAMQLRLAYNTGRVRQGIDFQREALKILTLLNGYHRPDIAPKV